MKKAKSVIKRAAKRKGKRKKIDAAAECREIAGRIPLTRHFMEGGDGVSAFLWISGRLGPRGGQRKVIVGSVNGASPDAINSALDEMREVTGVESAWYNLD